MSTETQKANQEIYNARRAEYMEAHSKEWNARGSGSEAHQAFYLWLSDWLGLPASLIPATVEEVKASTDPHLNDIPLHRWDRMHDCVRRYAGKLGFWSLSDTVCCLKAMARRRNELLTK